MNRPLGYGEAFLLSLAFHVAVCLLLGVSFVASRARSIPPPRPEPKPVAFRFVDQPETPPPAEPPAKQAPLSDKDRAARGPSEPSPEPPRNPQPRMEGQTAEMTLPTRPPTPPIPRPEPRVPKTLRRRPEAPERAPLPEKPSAPTPEEKRRTILERLAELEKGDVLQQKFDNPDGKFFDSPDTDISFETQAVDWGPYAARLHRIVKRNWIIPPAAQIGTKGVVRLKFDIGKDGSIRNLEVLDESGTRSLDDAAWAAIKNSYPLPPPPLPKDWPKDTVGVRWTFYYNTRPR